MEVVVADNLVPAKLSQSPEVLHSLSKTISVSGCGPSQKAVEAGVHRQLCVISPKDWYGRRGSTKHRLAKNLTRVRIDVIRNWRAKPLKVLSLVLLPPSAS